MSLLSLSGQSIDFISGSCAVSYMFNMMMLMLSNCHLSTDIWRASRQLGLPGAGLDKASNFVRSEKIHDTDLIILLAVIHWAEVASCRGTSNRDIAYLNYLCEILVVWFWCLTQTLRTFLSAGWSIVSKQNSSPPSEARANIHWVSTVRWRDTAQTKHVSINREWSHSANATSHGWRFRFLEWKPCFATRSFKSWASNQYRIQNAVVDMWKPERHQCYTGRLNHSAA